MVYGYSRTNVRSGDGVRRPPPRARSTAAAVVLAAPAGLLSASGASAFPATEEPAKPRDDCPALFELLPGGAPHPDQGDNVIAYNFMDNPDDDRDCTEGEKDLVRLGLSFLGNLRTPMGNVPLQFEEVSPGDQFTDRIEFEKVAGTDGEGRDEFDSIGAFALCPDGGPTATRVATIGLGRPLLANETPISPIRATMHEVLHTLGLHHSGRHDSFESSLPTMATCIGDGDLQSTTTDDRASFNHRWFQHIQNWKVAHAGGDPYEYSDFDWVSGNPGFEHFTLDWKRSTPDATLLTMERPEGAPYMGDRHARWVPSSFGDRMVHTNRVAAGWGDRVVSEARVRLPPGADPTTTRIYTYTREVDYPDGGSECGAIDGMYEVASNMDEAPTFGPWVGVHQDYVVDGSAWERVAIQAFFFDGSLTHLWIPHEFDGVDISTQISSTDEVWVDNAGAQIGPVCA